MATQLQIRRGTASQIAAFTGAEGEVVVNTTNDSIHVNDGSTAGGFELARVDGSNWAITNDITTTSNINVGTVTADGLTVDGNGSFTGNSPKIFLNETDTTDVNTRIRNAAGKLQIQTVDNSDSNPVTRFLIDHATGDISFYEDTGTNARVVWDSSAETFAIGNIQGSAAGTLKVKSDSDHRGLVIEENNGQEVYQLGVVADGSLVFQNSGSEVVRFDDSGNVGIGTSSPSHELTVGDANAETIIGVAGNRSQFGFKSDLAVVQGGSGKGIQFNVNNNTFGSGEAMRIDSSGNVGIGTSSPTALLHLNSTAPSILMQDSDGTGRSSINCDNGSLNLKFNSNNAVGTSVLTFSDFNTERMRIDSSGNLLVGTTTTGSGAQSGVAIAGGASSSDIYIRHANGTSSGAVYASFIYNTSQIGRISQNGTSQVLYQVSSDQRLKLNISDADDSSAIIDAIRVRKFDWKSDGEHQRYGMIAQELQNVAPEAVGDVSDPDEMLGVDYSKLVPMLVKEIQSLRARVAQLEN
jgi:hypothetical protein